MIEPISYFMGGFLIGHLMPRVPFMVLSRRPGFNKRFPEHPHPIPLSPHLTQRVLHMRRFHRLGTWTTLLPLLIGYMCLVGGQAPLGYGMFLASGWTILSRAQSLLGGPTLPCTLEMAQNLQLIMNRCDSDDSCCSTPSPEWRIEDIRCASCSEKLEGTPRPDLGRNRQDGFFRGWLRLWISDGRPMVMTEPSEK